MNIVSWLGFFFSVTGNVMIAKKNPKLLYGLLSFLAGNILWICFCAFEDKTNWALILQNLIFFTINANGVVNWYKGNRKDKK